MSQLWRSGVSVKVRINPDAADQQVNRVNRVKGEAGLTNAVLSP